MSRSVARVTARAVDIAEEVDALARELKEELDDVDDRRRLDALAEKVRRHLKVVVSAAGDMVAVRERAQAKRHSRVVPKGER